MYKKYRVQTTDSAHDYPVVKNLLNREFTAEKPGQKWVSDITYIPTEEGWLYLTTVLDLADRKVIGWALSDSLKAVDTSVAAKDNYCFTRIGACSMPAPSSAIS